MSTTVKWMWQRSQKSAKGSSKSNINCMITIDGDVTIEDIDEALANIKDLLVDKYGQRLTHQKRELLWSSIDDLLDARLDLLSKEGKNGSSEKATDRLNS